MYELNNTPETTLHLKRRMLSLGHPLLLEQLDKDNENATFRQFMAFNVFACSSPEIPCLDLEVTGSFYNCFLEVACKLKEPFHASHCRVISKSR